MATEQIHSPLAGKTAVIVGRWQIFHKGHETLLTAALAEAEQVVVVIGSAFRSRNPKNPFGWWERKAMIEATLTPAQIARITFVPIRDYFDDRKWTDAVTVAVRQVQTSPKPPVFVTFKKDASGYYQDNFPGWSQLRVPAMHAIDATVLRDVFFGGSSSIAARIAVLEPYVHPGVLDYLQAWAQMQVYAEQAAEHMAVKAYREKWGEGPFLTADAVVSVTVEDERYVLLIQRKGEGLDCGRGLWGVPGGFLDPGERHYDAAVRELKEETGLSPLQSTMRNALKAVQMFDHPGRSARAWLVTQAHHFVLGHQAALPELRASDEVLQAQWVRVADLPQFAGKMLDDHDAILDHFVGVYPT